MPLFDWECKHCELQVTLLRSFDHYKRAPEDAEMGEAAKCTKSDDGKHGWRRDWSKGVPRFVRGPSYDTNGGGKGNWLVLVAGAAGLLKLVGEQCSIWL